MPQEIEAKVKPIIGNSVAGNEACRQWVEEQMSRLSLEEKVGQLMVYKLTPELTKANRNLLNSLVKNYHIGGLLFSGGKLQGQASVINLAQELTDIPMMITCDGEWGLGMRMTDAVSYPRNRVLGCIQEDSLIYAYGLESARQMRELGITVNFAPVADVDNNPNNPVINTRSFGEDPALVNALLLDCCACDKSISLSYLNCCDTCIPAKGLKVIFEALVLCYCSQDIYIDTYEFVLFVGILKWSEYCVCCDNPNFLSRCLLFVSTGKADASSKKKNQCKQ